MAQQFLLYKDYYITFMIRGYKNITIIELIMQEKKKSDIILLKKIFWRGKMGLLKKQAMLALFVINIA